MEARFLTIEDLGHLPPPKWLIEDLFEQESIVMLVGPPGALKSFLAIDWALSLALGRPWNKRAVEPCNVLYALGEGKASLLKRIEAWKLWNNLSKSDNNRLNSNFRVTFDVPQLAVQRDFTEFLDDLDLDGFQPGCIIIDTLARSFVGRNENDQLDAGLWVESADRLRQRGMTVIALHHTKKNTEFGLQYRGSSALQGAMDSAFVLEKNPDGFKKYAKLSCSKQKDHAEPADIWMQWETIKSNDGEGSLILVEVEKPDAEIKEAQHQNEVEIDTFIRELLSNGEFMSDRARAREVATKFGITETSAQTKVSRARR